MGRLEGKCAVVTGVSKGIGRAIAATFLAEGATVIGIARHADALAGLEGNLTALEGSVSDPATSERALAAAQAAGCCDILVNAAGVFPTAVLAETAPADARGVVDTNFFGVFHFCRAFVPAMAARGSGCVVNVTSLAARAPVPGMAVYAASKAAVEAFTRSVAGEVAGKVRLNCLAPGPTWTETVESLMANDTTGAAQQVVASIPMGRFGEVEEMADAALFLAVGKGAAFMTGQTLQVNGGALMA